MTVLALVVTDAGLARFTAAQAGDPVDLTVARVGLTDQPFVAAPTLDALPGEFRRVDTLSGEAVGDDVVHLIIRDDAPIAYGVRGFGLFFADGTLFATYAAGDARIFDKSALASMLLQLDVAFPRGTVETITFGDANFLNPPATAETKGVVELATLEEGQAGVDPMRVPPVLVVATLIAAARQQLNAAMDTLQTTLQGAMTALQSAIFARRIDTSGLLIGGGDLSANRLFTVPAASTAEVLAGISEGKAVTPSALAGLAHSHAPTGFVTLPGGLVLQWGQYRGSTTSETTVTVPFPLPFPNACFARSATGFIAGPSTSKDLWVQLAGGPSLTELTVQYQQATGDRAIDGFDWFAIGN